MKCKVFRNFSDTVENAINDWLKTDNYDIFDIKQNIRNDDLVVTTIFYLTEKELRKKKLNNLNNHDTED